MTKGIPLTNGKITLVDDEDASIYAKHKWYDHHGYASIVVQKDKVRKRIYLHREVMNAPQGMVVDHINKDTLDNRKSNLRVCQQCENIRNMKRRADSRFKYKGTRYNKVNKNWNARIRINSKEIHLGCFETEILAAQAYNEAAVKYHQEYAQLNTIED